MSEQRNISQNLINACPCRYWLYVGAQNILFSLMDILIHPTNQGMHMSRTTDLKFQVCHRKHILQKPWILRAALLQMIVQPNRGIKVLLRETGFLCLGVFIGSGTSSKGRGRENFSISLPSYKYLGCNSKLRGPFVQKISLKAAFCFGIETKRSKLVSCLYLLPFKNVPLYNLGYYVKDSFALEIATR